MYGSGADGVGAGEWYALGAEEGLYERPLDCAGFRMGDGAEGAEGGVPKAEV